MTNTADKTVEAPLPPEGSPRKKRRPTGGLECKLGLLLGIGGLIGSRLGHLWIAFDVFSQFTLQFAVVALGFGIGALMPRAKLLIAFVVVIMGLLAIGIWPHVATSAATPMAEAAAGERQLKIASFNTLYVNQDAGAVAAEIKRLDADLIVLLEMGPGKRRVLVNSRVFIRIRRTATRSTTATSWCCRKSPSSKAMPRRSGTGRPISACALGQRLADCG